jgi:hypothetical protein
MKTNVLSLDFFPVQFTKEVCRSAWQGIQSGAWNATDKQTPFILGAAATLQG